MKNLGPGYCKQDCSITCEGLELRLLYNALTAQENMARAVEAYDPWQAVVSGATPPHIGGWWELDCIACLIVEDIACLIVEDT